MASISHAIALPLILQLFGKNQHLVYIQSFIAQGFLKSLISLTLMFYHFFVAKFIIRHLSENFFYIIGHLIGLKRMNSILYNINRSWNLFTKIE